MFNPHLMTRIRIAFLAFYLLMVAIFSSCNKKDRITNSDQMEEYLIAYTRGTINSNQELRFVFKEDIFRSLDDASSLIQTTPDIQGQAIIRRPNELVFKPTHAWLNGASYTINLRLKHILPETFDVNLRYKINIVEQHMRVDLAGVRLDKQGNHRYSLKVITADDVAPQELRKCFDTNTSKVVVTRSGEKEYMVEVRFDGGINKNSYLKYDGAPIHTEDKGSIDLFQEELFEQFAEFFNDYDRSSGRFKIFFTRLLQEDQELKGMIQLDGQACDYTRDQNVLTIYLPATANKNESVLTIDGQLADIHGNVLGEDLSFTLGRNLAKPKVQFALAGNYLPSKGKVIVPIRTRNLKAVQVRIVEIPPANVRYYLSWRSIQSYNSSFLRQMGKPVYYETLNLPGAVLTSGSEWENYALDLTEKFEKKPGYMYAMELRFGPQNTLLDCSDEFQKLDLSSSLNKELSDWDKPDNIYWGSNMWHTYMGYRYNWREKDNPCKLLYYTSSEQVGRNFMVSDLAIIAKQGDQEVSVAVADLHTLKSVSNAEVELIDYQGMSMGKNRTSVSGIAEFKVDRKAQAAKVTHRDQQVYMPMHQNNANPLSAYPTSGSSEEDDRFFLYTERGVWRPGDSIHLCLMMDREKQKIPDGLPLVVEFYDYKNTLLKRMRDEVSKDQQIYCFTLGTSLQARTGTYEAQVHIGASTLRRSLPVETIRPNDVEIVYNLTREKDRLVQYPRFEGQLQANYLNGFPLPDAKLSVKAAVYPIRQPFEKYKQFSFISSKTKSKSALKLFSGKTNEEGRLELQKTPDMRQFNARANVVLESSVELPGGGLNKEAQSFTIDPFQRYVGIKDMRGNAWGGSLNVDKSIDIPVVLLDRKGKKVNGERELKAKLYKYGHSWWVDRYALSRNASYQRSRYWKLVDEVNVIVKNGVGAFTHEVSKLKKGSFMLLITDGDRGHQASNVYTIYDQKEASKPLASADALMVDIDKEECTVGESVALNYPEFEEARVLVSIEQGDKIIDQFWKDLNPQNRTLVLNPADSWAPNVYVHSTLIQAYGTVSNDRPLRMYSVQPLKVEKKAPGLTPQIDMPDELETGAPFMVHVSNQQKDAMEYTLAVVDEGLLNLTGFNTPDPYNHFYGKKALRVNTWDIYKLLMRQFQGKYAGILSIGGDDAYRADVASDINRFKSVVKFIGPLQLASGKSATHEIEVNEFMGKLRVMLIGANEYGAGMAEKKVRVKSPLMLQAQVPRSLNVTDKVRVPVTIFKDAPNIKTASLSAETTSAVHVVQNNKNIPLSKLDQSTEFFGLEVQNEPGATDLIFNVSGGGKSMSEKHSLMIHYPNSYESQSNRKQLKKGEASEWVLSAPSYPKLATYSLQVSGIKLPNCKEYAHRLIRYPYGCLEQTVSKGMGQLYLDQVLDLSSLEIQEIQYHLQEALDKLSSFLGADGRLNQWPGSSYYHEWSAVYAGYFLLEARNKRLNIPEGLLDNWQKNQTNNANKWNVSGASNKRFQVMEEQVQAFRLFLLAKSGAPALGAMNRLSQGATDNYMTAILLAGAYQLAAYEEMANQWVSKALDLYKDGSRNATYSRYTYGGLDRNQCLMVDVLSLFPEQKDKMSQLYENVVDRLNKRHWVSTQTMGFALIAASRFLKGNQVNFQGSNLKFQLTVEGQKREFNVDYFNSQAFSFDARDEGEKVILKNIGETVIYVQEIMRYIPDELDRKATSSNLSITASFNGQSLTGSSDRVNLTRGDEVRIHVRVGNEGLQNFSNLALNVKMPAGLELLNPRIFKTANVKRSSRYIHQDYRDDRVYTFFNLNRGNSASFYFVAKAAFSGDFYLPAVRCEHMYNGEVYASTPTGRCVVE